MAQGIQASSVHLGGCAHWKRGWRSLRKPADRTPRWLWWHAACHSAPGLSKIRSCQCYRLHVIALALALTRYCQYGRIEIDNNAAERALRTVALGRQNYLFAGSDAGGERAAAVLKLDRHRQAQWLESRSLLTRGLHSHRRTADQSHRGDGQEGRSELLPNCHQRELPADNTL